MRGGRFLSVPDRQAAEEDIAMRLLFRQRFFSWFDSYDIYDESGNVVFTVEGKPSWGHTLHILDRQGNHVGRPCGDDAAHAAQRTALQAGRGFRLGLLLAAAAALRCGFGQNSREFPYQMRSSG